MPTEDLAHYVERGRKGVERNRRALQGIQRRLAIRDDEVSTGDDISALPRYVKDKTREDLVALQQKAQREVSDIRTRCTSQRPCLARLRPFDPAFCDFRRASD